MGKGTRTDDADLPAAHDAYALAFQDALVRAVLALLPAGAQMLPVAVVRPASPQWGDLSSSVALRLAKTLKRPAQEVAEELVAQIGVLEGFASISVAPPGFINATLADASLAERVPLMRTPGWWRASSWQGKRVQVEYVSANPTGPLTIGNARGGPIGDVLSRVLTSLGAEVTREYYLENTGTQVKLLAESVDVRYRQLHGERVRLPRRLDPVTGKIEVVGYRGGYVKEIARAIGARDGDAHLARPAAERLADFETQALATVIADIQATAASANLHFDRYFSQAAFLETGVLDALLKEAAERGLLVAEGEAQMLALPGDEPWALVRTSGEPSYFGKDLAYHLDALRNRKFDLKIDVWGSNTHGHALRMGKALAAFGIEPTRSRILLYQYVRLVRNGKPIKMSKRSGSFVTLAELLSAVGADVTRFFLLTRAADSPLDFDLDAASKRTADNPAFTVQYAHARCVSLLTKGIDLNLQPAQKGVAALATEAPARALISTLGELPALVEDVAVSGAVHQIATYALALAQCFHSFYESGRVLDAADEVTSGARLALVDATRVALHDVLDLLGMDAPDHVDAPTPLVVSAQ